MGKLQLPSFGETTAGAILALSQEEIRQEGKRALGSWKTRTHALQAETHNEMRGWGGNGLKRGRKFQD